MGNSISISFHVSSYSILQYRRQRERRVELKKVFYRFCSRTFAWFLRLYKVTILIYWEHLSLQQSSERGIRTHL